MFHRLGFFSQLKPPRLVHNTEHELQTSHFYITPMMQRGRAFPSCTAAANQGRATGRAVAGPGNQLDAQSRRSPGCRFFGTGFSIPQEFFLR